MIRQVTDNATDITLELYHGDTDSALFLKYKGSIIGRKYYTRRIHKHESRSDFDRLNTELQTYGYQHGMLPEWDRITAN